jgi:hypothetical protein
MKRAMKGRKKGDKHRVDGHRDGTGIPPSKFSGKKPMVEKGKKAREKRLEGKAM